MADIKLDNVQDPQGPQVCLYTDIETDDKANDSLNNDGYPSGLPLVLNLLAIGLATVLVGYVSPLQCTIAWKPCSQFLGCQLRGDNHPFGH